MTPKEKAQELINRFSKVGLQQREEGIECALICVDEIITVFLGMHKPEYAAFDAIGERKYTYEAEYDTHMTGYNMIGYFEEVKTEIKKP
jgi:hypothetical protein